jgi:uncharacterized protein YukE
MSANNRIMLVKPEATTAANAIRSQTVAEIESCLGRLRNEIGNNYKDWWDGLSFFQFQTRFADRDAVYSREVIDCLNDQAARIDNHVVRKTEHDESEAALMSADSSGVMGGSNVMTFTGSGSGRTR